MFKMGCSMAKKILAIDKQSSHLDQGASGSASASASASGSSSGKKDKQQDSSFASNQATSVKGKTDELGDFSKLEQDPRIPLNIRQIFKITKSWKAIARTMSKTGTAMFLNLFEQNQDLFYLFDRFQHLKGKELHESMELREHASTVMATLDQSINSLSDYDNFVTYLHSIGKLHRKVPGFKRAHFWKIEQPFLKAVKQTLDERCNESIEEIYKIAIKLIIETIADGYGEDDELTVQNERKDSSSAGGSNSNNGNGKGNGENSKDFSGSNSNTRARGNSGNTTPNKLASQQATGTKKVVVAFGASSGFVNIFHSEKEDFSSISISTSDSIQGRKQKKKKRKAEKSCMRNGNLDSNAELLNSRKPLSAKLEFNLKQDTGRQSAEIQQKQAIQSGNFNLNERKSQGNQINLGKTPKCSIPSSSSNNDLAASPLKQPPNGERLTQTLFVLEGLLSSLMAKKRENKNVVEEKVNKFTEANLTHDEMSLASKKVDSLAERETNVNEAELEAEESVGRGVNKFSLNFEKKVNDEGLCWQYKEKFYKDNSSCYSIDDRTLQAYDRDEAIRSRSRKLDGQENSLNSDEMTCRIDQQPRFVIEQATSKLNKQKQGDGKCLDNSDIAFSKLRSRSKSGSGSKSLEALYCKEKCSLKEEVILALESPSRVKVTRKNETRGSKFNDQKLAEEWEANKQIACSQAKNQVSLGSLEVECHDVVSADDDYDSSSENVNYNDNVENTTSCLVSQFPLSPSPHPHSISILQSSSPPLCHTKSVKWHAVGKDGSEKSEVNGCSAMVSCSPICSKSFTTEPGDIVKTSNARQIATHRPASDNELPQNNTNSARSQACSTSSDVVPGSNWETVEAGKSEASKELDVNERSTVFYLPRWKQKFVCSLLTKTTAKTTKAAATKGSPRQQTRLKPRITSSQQKLPLVSDHDESEKRRDEGRIHLFDGKEVEQRDRAESLGEEEEYKQTNDRQARLNTNGSYQFGAKKQTKSFLMPPFWSHIKQSSLRKSSLFGIRETTSEENSGREKNRNKKQKRKQTNHHHHHHHNRRQKQHRKQPDVSLETPLERSPLPPPKGSGEHLGELEGKIKLEIASKKSNTSSSPSFSSSLLTTDLGDLSELIKMLMLTITSKKQHYHHLELPKTTATDLNPLHV